MAGCVPTGVPQASYKEIVMTNFSEREDMYKYILESKDAVRHIIADRQRILKAGLEYLGASEVEQIYLIGSGTSYHANLASKNLMEKVLGMKVFVSYPLPFKDNEMIFNHHTLVMGSSHGGQSSSTIGGLDKARELRLKTMASTATVESEITKHADVTIYCEIGEENAGPKTKGYFGAMATNMLFALEAAEVKGKITRTEKEAYIERMQTASDNIPVLAEKAVSWYEKNKAELVKARRLVIIGYQNNIPTMMEGTLKILEAVRYGVTGYEMEEFMHGIYHLINNDCFVFYIGAKGQYYERMVQLKKYFEGHTEHNFMFTSDTTIDDGRNFTASFIDDVEFSQFEYIVPLQVVARKLSADLGINCNIPSDPDFHRKMGSYRF
jgi:glucosamine 6-phosphate synthetase-like amidotransferase/phosphosugar isomerase protein